MIKKILAIILIFSIGLLVLCACDAFADRTSILEYMQKAREEQNAINADANTDNGSEQVGGNAQTEGETAGGKGQGDTQESGGQSENTSGGENGGQSGENGNNNDDAPTLLTDTSDISGQYALYIDSEYKCEFSIYNSGKVQANANLKQTTFNLYERTGTDKITRNYIKIGEVYREIVVLRNERKAILDATKKEYEDFIVYAEKQVKCSECGNVLNEQGGAHKESCSKYASLPVNSPASPVINGFGGVIENLTVTTITENVESWSVELHYLTKSKMDNIVNVLSSSPWQNTALNIRYGAQYVSSRKVVAGKMLTLDVTLSESGSYYTATISVSVVGI